MENNELPACPVETTLTLIGNKWKVLILRDLMPGSKRFGKLQRSIGKISQKVLTSNFNAYEKEISIPNPRVPTSTSTCFYPFYL